MFALKSERNQTGKYGLLAIIIIIPVKIIYYEYKTLVRAYLLAIFTKLAKQQSLKV